MAIGGLAAVYSRFRFFLIKSIAADPMAHTQTARIITKPIA
jgi:hypothetical protein